MLSPVKQRILSNTLRAAAIFAVALGFGQEVANPWPDSALLQPADLAKTLRSSDKKPVVICVAFPVLYRSKHIAGAIYAGPGNTPAGIETLRKAVADLPKDSDVVLYCGCCPMKKCPNIRPSYALLKEMGFARVRVLSIPENMPTDWYGKNYPSGAGSAGGQ
jgi:thiosulfate/3-mercaptopyruvate sulfurtransferase